MSQQDIVVIAVVVGAAFSLLLLLVAIAVTSSAGSARNHTVRRIRAVEQRFAGVRVGADDTVRLDRQADPAPWANRVRSLMPSIRVLQERIDRTGREIPISRFAILCLGIGLAVALLLFLVLGQPLPVCLAGGIVAGLGLPFVTLDVLAKRRVAQFIAEFPEALDLMVRGLKSGLPLGESISTIARDMSGPIAEEFSYADEATQVGVPLEDALTQIGKRITSPDYRFFAVAISVQRETGGNLGETLQNLADILRKRRQMKLKIRAMTSEVRTSAYVIGAMPFIIGAGIGAVSPEQTSLLFTDPRGKIMLAIGSVSYLLGVFSMWKLTRFEI